jgi:hypothetical protein
MSEEKDLINLWKSQQPASSREWNAGEIKSAAKKSEDVFKKIYRNIKWEIGFTAVMIPAAIYAFRDEGVFLWLFVALLSIAIVVSVPLYRNVIVGLKNIEEVSVKESLQKKVGVLQKYISQLHLYVYVFTPISFYLGFFISLQEDGDKSSEELLIACAIGFPFMLLTIYLMKRYVYWLYGKHLKSLEKLLDHLEDPD